MVPAHHAHALGLHPRLELHLRHGVHLHVRPRRESAPPGNALSTVTTRASASQAPPRYPITSFVHRCACVSMTSRAAGRTTTRKGCAPGSRRCPGACSRRTRAADAERASVCVPEPGDGDGGFPGGFAFGARLGVLRGFDRRHPRGSNRAVLGAIGDPRTPARAACFSALAMRAFSASRSRRVARGGGGGGGFRLSAPPSRRPPPLPPRETERHARG